jgi:peptide/nickel transport system ATP-binding protein
MIAARPAPAAPTALDVRELRVRFRGRDRRAPEVLAVDGIDLHLDGGRILALAGESGSGKSVTLLALAGLLPESAVVEGTVTLDGVSLLGLSERSRASLRGRGMGIVFQDPGGSLNPVVSIGAQVDEVVTVHRGLRGAAARAETEALLARCGIGDPRRRAEAFPHQLSGGLRQRAAIAAALAAHPRVLLADEPTTALDATVQAQILDLLVDLVDETGVAMLLVTHDLAVAGAVADRIAVMYAGRIVEEGEAAALMARPAHPYSEALRLAALPFAASAASQHDRLPELPGRMARAGGIGCAFAPRCPLVIDRCRVEAPPLAPFEDGRAACWRAGEVSLSPRPAEPVP